MSTHIKTIKGRAELIKRHPYGFNMTNYISEDIIITRFYEGNKGNMIQLSISKDKIAHIQLTKPQIKKLIKVLQDAFDYDKYPSK